MSRTNQRRRSRTDFAESTSTPSLSSAVLGSRCSSVSNQAEPAKTSPQWRHEMQPSAYSFFKIITESPPCKPCLREMRVIGYCRGVDVRWTWSRTFWNYWHTGYFRQREPSRFTPILFFRCLFVSELGAYTEQTDRRTDGRTGKTRNAAY